MVAVTAPQHEPTDVVVRRVESLDEYLAAHLVTADVFGMDDEFRQAFLGRAERLWEVEHKVGLVATFVALIDGEVVASARAYLGQTAVFLAGGGTRPDARGRGAYRALVRARWDAAVERGTPALTVGAGEMSRPILERLGFTIVGWYDCLLDDLANGNG
jgi:GNAT superfamily N-acetyltransferase